MSLVRTLALAIAAVATALFLFSKETDVAMAGEQNDCTQDTREQIEQAVLKAFPDSDITLAILSCHEGGTPFASFSHFSAEVETESIGSVGGMQPVGDPAWLPFDLMPGVYRQSFEGVDWQKVNYAEANDPDSGARVFLITRPDGRSFVLVTSE